MDYPANTDSGSDLPPVEHTPPAADSSAPAAAASPDSATDLPPSPAPQTPYGGYVAPSAVPPPPAFNGQKKSKRKQLIWLIVVVALLFICGLVAFVARLGFMFSNQRPVSEQSSASEAIIVPDDATNPSSDELSVQVAKKVLPSVVSISLQSSGSQNPFMGGEESSQSSGSGVILKSDGYIVTNNHVVEGSDSIEVTAGDQTYKAKLVGTDPSTDLAVLKIDATDLPAVEVGTSKNLEVGQYVMAIGSPFGLEKSVSSGIISGLGRSDLMSTQSYITAYIDLIQTDAAINPGNSGGALVDKTGKLIGINSLINSTSGSSAGVGFAIPVDTVAEIANQLMDTGTATHAFLGIGTQTVTAEVAQAYGFPVESGAVVASVSSGSPAEKAGIKKGDIIVKIGDDKIESTEKVFSAVRSHKVGDEITIEFYRGGKKQSVKAKLSGDERAQTEQQEEQQEQQQQQEQIPNGGGNSGDSGDPHEGFTLEELYDLLRRQGLGQ